MKGKIIIAFLFALLALTLIGLVGQNTLTQLIVSIKKESQPNQKLSSLKEILTDLSNAESSIRTYTITQETENLTPFYQSVTTFDAKMQKFYSAIRNKGQMKLADSMENMIGNKYLTMKKLIDIKKDRDANKVLQQVLDNISKLRARDSVPRLIDKNDAINSDFNDEVIQKVDVPEPEARKKKKSLFQRIFGKNDEEEDETADTNIENAGEFAENDNDTSPEEATVDSTSSGPSTSITTPKQIRNNDLNSREIGLMINKIGQEETRNMQAVRQEELNLTIQDGDLMKQIRNLANQFEDREKKISLNRAESAQKATDKAIDIITITWIAALTIFAVLLFIIFKDISINQKNKNRLRKEKERAEKLARVKEQFLSNMSHEIRTPMNSIIGFTEQLENSELNESQQKYLQSIQHSGTHLLRLINDILDYTKLESGKLPMESIGFEVRESVRTVVDSFKNQVKVKGLEVKQKIDPNIPDVIIGDPVRFEQILINLLSNAIKFTASGEIKIELKSREIAKNEVQIQLIVADSGIGIPKNKMNSIFKDFAQVDSSVTRKYGGTGLGLSIVKKIVNIQNGNISVESEEGEGTTFIIDINYKTGVKADLKQQIKNLPLDYQKLTGKKILVVDDQEYNLELIKVIFNKWKINGSMATSGIEAIENYKINSFDLILMDVQMPEMSGLEATKKIRALEKEMGSKTPIIALTAATSQEEAKDCMTAGMDGYLLKPFTQRELYNKLIESITANEKSRVSENKTTALNALDLRDLHELSNGDPSFVINMLEIFIKNFSQDLDEIKIGLHEQNWDKLKAKAHKMIPPCRHLGFTTMVDLLKKLEEEGSNSQNIQTVDKLVQDIISLYEQIKPEIEKEINTLKKNKSETLA